MVSVSGTSGVILGKLVSTAPEVVCPATLDRPLRALQSKMATTMVNNPIKLPTIPPMSPFVRVVPKGAGRVIEVVLSLIVTGSPVLVPMVLMLIVLVLMLVTLVFTPVYDLSEYLPEGRKPPAELVEAE